MKKMSDTMVCLRSGQLRAAATVWSFGSVEFGRLDPQQLLDVWIVCRATKSIVGAAVAVNINGDFLELVEPRWFERPAKLPSSRRRRRSGIAESRVLKKVPASVVDMPQVRSFFAGNNSSPTPVWWRSGERPADPETEILEAPIPTPRRRFPWRTYEASQK